MSTITMLPEPSASDRAEQNPDSAPDVPIFADLVRRWSADGRLIPGDDRDWNAARLTLMPTIEPSPVQDPAAEHEACERHDPTETLWPPRTWSGPTVTSAEAVPGHRTSPSRRREASHAPTGLEPGPVDLEPVIAPAIALRPPRQDPGTEPWRRIGLAGD